MEVCRRYGPDTRQSQDAVRFGISGLSCMSAALGEYVLRLFVEIHLRMALSEDLRILGK